MRWRSGGPSAPDTAASCGRRSPKACSCRSAARRAGLVLAIVCVQVLASAAPGSIPRVGTAGVDGAVLLFALLVGIGTTGFFSIAPIARLVRLDPVQSLKEGGQSTPGAARQRFRQALIAGEMALAVLLLVCAGLMVRSIWAMEQVPLGFDPARRADGSRRAAGRQLFHQ